MMTCEIILAAVMFAPGQDGTKPDDARLATQYQTVRSATNEQIEVMRALLMRKLVRTAGTGTQPLAVFGDTLHVPVANEVNYGLSPYRNVATAIEPAIEGAYLDGYGVVFTVTLPATGRDPRQTTGDKPEPALTDWERERRRLLGQPVPERAAAPKQTSVSDILVKLLADNGKNFSGLKEDERVVIAVTFRSDATGAAVTALPQAANSTADPTASYFAQPMAVREDRVATLENLGDLHLKQGQPDKAIEAYAKAVEAADNDLGRASADERPRFNDRAAKAYGKLAQGFLAAGKVDDARSMLEMMDNVARAPQTKTDPKPRAANRAAQLRMPARLTVSAPKKVLDLVGNGQMNLDEFRKKATVEYVPAGKGWE